MTGRGGSCDDLGMITHDHTHPLSTDSYYRGYRFAWCKGQVHIYSHHDLIFSMSTQDGDPRDIVDGWLDAR